MAQPRGAGGENGRVDRDTLSAVAVRRGRVGHPPVRTAIAQDHMAEIAAWPGDRPWQIGMAAMAERGAARLLRITRATPSNHWAPILPTVTRRSGGSPA